MHFNKFNTTIEKILLRYFIIINCGLCYWCSCGIGTGMEGLKSFFSHLFLLWPRAEQGGEGDRYLVRGAGTEDRGGDPIPLPNSSFLLFFIFSKYLCNDSLVVK